jgi:hypothetical protein
MVADTYSERDRRVFREGLAALNDECRRMHGVAFMAAPPEARLALLERLDAEQMEHMRSRAAGEPAHYFRMIKELSLLGYFTSEIGYNRAMRYIESPAASIRACRIRRASEHGRRMRDGLAARLIAVVGWTITAGPLHGQPAAPNALSDDERAAGWMLLFDGRTLAGWRGYNRPDLPGGWAIDDGALARVGPGGDIITIEQYGDFELALEWRVQGGGNSGIFYRAEEGHAWIYESAPEMQLLDDRRHPDGRDPLTTATRRPASSRSRWICSRRRTSTRIASCGAIRATSAATAPAALEDQWGGNRAMR